jgi:hypothetical protein
MSEPWASIYNKYFLRLNDSCGCWQGWNDGQELVYSNKQHRKQPIKVLSLKSVPYWWGGRAEAAVEQWAEEDAKWIFNELRRTAWLHPVAIGRTRKQLEEWSEGAGTDLYVNVIFLIWRVVRMKATSSNDEWTTIHKRMIGYEVHFCFSLFFLLLPLWSIEHPWNALFLNPKNVGGTPWTGDQPVARQLPNINTE